MRKVAKIFGRTLGVLIVLGVLAYLNRGELMRAVFDLPEFETASGDRFAEQVEMRDGVKLATRIYLPEGDGPWPVVLIRDPYNGYSLTCQMFARYGMGCVHQDVRGRYDSEGEWYPLIHERDDGLDTLDWLLEQPWQNGRLATFGGSYVGLVQWAMIDAMPDNVVTAVIDIAHGDWYQAVYRRGHFVQGVMSMWALSLHESDSDFYDMVAHRPAVESNAAYLGKSRRWYDDFLRNPNKFGPYWQGDVYQHTRDGHKSARMPILLRGAWHDIYVGGQLKDFERLPRRSDSLFIVRNGSHSPVTIAEGVDVFRRNLNQDLRWMQHYLLGREMPSDLRPGLLLQDNIDGQLVHFDNWPIVKSQRVYHLSEIAETSVCDGGKLTPRAALGSNSASFVYDPSDPVPSVGGSFGLLDVGVYEQGNENCMRDDVLSFESEIFSNGLTIDGQMIANIEVSSDANDSAFTVKVQEKRADGSVVNIRDDIISLSHRGGEMMVLPYKAGEAVTLEFELMPIRWGLAPGSSLRIDISSSNFPIYNAHPNVTGNWALSSDEKVARQTLFGGELIIPTEE